MDADGRKASSFLRPVSTALAAAALAAYVGIAVWYAAAPSYFDPAEPTVTAVAFAFGAGQPLYPSLDAAERYAHVWGPALFLVHASVMTLAGPSIVASKAVGASAAVLSLVVGFFLFRGRAGSAAAIVASGLCALVYLAFSNVTFWTRGDPLLLLCSVLGLLGATRRSAATAAVWLGVALGVAVNLKVTGVMYLLPALALLHAAHGTRPALAATGIAALVGTAPFLVSSISLTNYLQYLQLSARDGVVWQKVRQNLIWLAFLTGPLAVLLWRARRQSKRSVVTWQVCAVLAVSTVLVVLAGAKPGGGAFHLLPFVPVLAFVSLSGWCEVDRASMTSPLAVFATAVMVIALASQGTLIRTVHYRDQDHVVEDLRRVAAAESGRRLAVGYAGTSHVSYARPEIVFRTGDYWLDAPAIQEHQRAGLALPAATIRRLDGCYVDTWLVPRSGEPFSVPNAYFAQQRVDVFPAEFRETFLRRYERTAASEYFDIWQCRR